MYARKSSDLSIRYNERGGEQAMRDHALGILIGLLTVEVVYKVSLRKHFRAWLAL